MQSASTVASSRLDVAMLSPPRPDVGPATPPPQQGSIRDAAPTLDDEPSLPAFEPDHEDTFYQLMSIMIDEPIGSMSISALPDFLPYSRRSDTFRLLSAGPANRDVALGARKGLFIVDLQNPYDPPRFLPHNSSWEVADVQVRPMLLRSRRRHALTLLMCSGTRSRIEANGSSRQSVLASAWAFQSQAETIARAVEPAGRRLQSLPLALLLQLARRTHSLRPHPRRDRHQLVARVARRPRDVRDGRVGDGVGPEGGLRKRRGKGTREEADLASVWMGR